MVIMNPELLAALQSLTNTTVTAQPGDRVTGAIRVFKSGALLGDLHVQRLPTNIRFNVAKSKDGAEYLVSQTEWVGIGHIGQHGRAWVDGLTDTGVAVADTPTTAVDFAALLASAKGTAAPATSTPAPNL